MSRTIIVSNRLPISVQKNDDGFSFTPSAGGLATGLGSIYKKGDNLWIGWPGLYLSKNSNKNEIAQELAKDNMSPVFLSKKDVEDFYEGFSNTTLWPLFHHFPKYTFFEEKYYEAYVKVNQIFAKKLLEHAKKDDTIWIHDYQLLLLPSLIRKELPEAKIGFFQHIPFPSFEIFRILPWREEILRGMLGADLIGFHTYDDVRHFLSSLSRTIGIDNTMGEIRSEGRIINIDAFPMGIDYNKFHSAAESKEVEKEVEEYSKEMGNIKLIVSIDRLDYTKGIPERLKAFERFLQEHPQFIEKVSLLMLVVPSREKVPLYRKLKIEIDELVGRINSKYRTISWSPIIYFYRSFPFETLSAFYKMSDVALITPTRDGMNLVCKEYVACRTDKTGVLILSEMAGAAKELSDALIINPNDIRQCVKALYKALSMPLDDQAKRIEEMQGILTKYDIHNWVKVFMKRLEYIVNKRIALSSKILSPTIQNQIQQGFKTSQKKIFFLAYDGTLVSLKEKPGHAKPDEEICSILSKLAEEENIKVVLISGRERNTVEKWFGNLGIDIVAEHGAWIKENNSWELLGPPTNEWKPTILEALEQFVERTPGSLIEEKEFSVVWHFRKADATLGDLRAKELVEYLHHFTNSLHLSILEGKKAIEVKNADINKGNAIQNWLAKDHYDFIFAAGDDWTDEEMFKVLPEHAFSIKMGYFPTLAKYNVRGCDENSCNELREILRSFVTTSESVYEFMDDLK